MDKSNAIIPVCAIDEEAEFRALSERTRARAKLAAKIERDREREEYKLWRRETARKRKTIRLARAFMCGVSAATCAFGVIVALKVAPGFAIFPAALAVLALWAGVKCR